MRQARLDATPDVEHVRAHLLRDAHGCGRPAVSGHERRAIRRAGHDTREIEVIAEPLRLLATGLTVHDVAAALREANRLAPVGRFSSAGLQHLVLVSGLWESAAQIAETPVVVRDGATVRVRDIAREFQGGLDRLFFKEDDELRKLLQTYGVF